MSTPSVFGGSSNQITDYENDMELDALLPPSGALDWSVDGIGAISAVDGTITGATGVDAKLIHGNLWEDIQGDQGTVITGTETRHTMTNVRTYVDYNATHIVGSDWLLTIVGQGTLNVFSGFSENQYGAVNRLSMMPVTEIYQANRTVQVPDSFDFETKLYDNSFVAGTQINIITGSETELVNHHLEIGVLHSEMKLTHPEVKVINAMSKVLLENTKATESEITATQAEAGISARIKLIGNALVSFGLGTPFR
jgi:hypothetical protein